LTVTEPLKLVLLGTGGPRPDPQRAGPAALIQVGDQNLLFDTGRGVVVQLVRAGIALPSIDTVFITHHHVDHIGDLHDVIISTWMAGRTRPLRIYGPPDTKRIVNALLTQVYDKDIEWRDQGEPALGGWKPVEAHDVGTGLVLETPTWPVGAETVVHGHGLTLPPAFVKRWICYGYRFEAGGRSIAISGDTVDCGGLRRLAEGADVLVQCCYLASAEITSEHFRRLSKLTLVCGDTVGKIAAAAGVKTLVLTHHWPRADDGMVDRLREEVARDFPGRLIVGRDLDEISVP
jgi:ribonuclease Z